MYFSAEAGGREKGREGGEQHVRRPTVAGTVGTVQGGGEGGMHTDTCGTRGYRPHARARAHSVAEWREGREHVPQRAVYDE